jgi:hypothetical protein
LVREVKFSGDRRREETCESGWRLLASGLWPIILIVALSLGLQVDILYALTFALE